MSTTNEAPRAPILLFPGEVGDLVDLNDFLVERVEDARAAQARRFDEAKTNGTTIEEEPIAPIARTPRLEGVSAQFVMLKEPARRTLGGKERSALGKLRRALAPLAETATEKEQAAAQDPEAIAAATNALFLARRAFVAEAVVAVDVGGRTLDVKTEAGLDVLERNDILIALFEAAAAFQEIGPGKASRSGSPPPSTSGASSASNALRSGVQDADASAARSSTALPCTSPAPSGPPTSAPGGT